MKTVVFESECVNYDSHAYVVGCKDYVMSPYFILKHYQCIVIHC
jgi:hypothetical protein